MGQCHVKRWIDDIVPVVMDDADPLGLETLATHRLPLAEAPAGLRDVPGEGRRLHQGGAQAVSTDVRAPLPQPRGALSGAVASTLARPPGRTHLSPDVEDALDALDEAEEHGYVHDGDAQLALWMLLELHHRGFEVVDDEWEWQPDLARIRTVLGRRLEAVVRDEVAEAIAEQVPAMVEDPAGTLFAVAGDGSRSPLARHVRRKATLEQWRELLVLKSVYQLKEGDAHS